MIDRRDAGPLESDQRESPFRSLFEICPEAMYVTTATGALVAVNPAMLQLVGYGCEELFAMNAADLYTDGEIASQLHGTESHPPPHEVDVRIAHRDGREIACLATVLVDRAEDGAIRGYHAMLRNPPEREHVDERLRHAALHDSLTQLPNRTAFLERLGRVLNRIPFQPSSRFAVLFIDLDRFKLVNDTLGHQPGDELLILVGERLAHAVRPQDIVARMGGDEFAVLLMNVGGATEAEAVAGRIQEAMSEAFEVLGNPVYISASVGIAISDPRHATADDIIRAADTAMYMSKESGRGWAVFDDTMQKRLAERRTTEAALRQALVRREFVLHYQPLVSIGTGRLVGFEALLRWQHPDRGLLYPDSFLRVAEESGLIIPIGEWVLREVCSVAGEWRKEMTDAPVVSVNLAARQLEVPALASQIRALLEEFDLPAAALRMEMTEGALAEPSKQARDTLHGLQALGIELCLDDFGTGYSSLGYLQSLPIRSVKIDRRFVHGIASAEDGGLVEALFSLARQLGISAVAEGVETEEQLEKLIRFGCSDVQGFLYSEPVPIAEANALLRSGSLNVKERPGSPAEPSR